MSAFMVPIEHVRAMINAGLQNREHDSPLSWSVRQLTDDERARAYQPGQSWGPEIDQIAQETMRQLTRDTAGTVGAMLLAQNRRSVDFRYDETDIEEPYIHRPSSDRQPVAMLRAVSCYEYQACETPDWEDTEAARFCQALRAHLIRQLDGYDDSETWPIEEASA